MAIGPRHHRRHGEAGGRGQDIFITFSHLFNFTLNQLPGYKLSERRGNNNRAKGHNILRREHSSAVCPPKHLGGVM